MSGRDNNQSQKSTSNKTTTNVSSQTTAQSPSVWQNMMTNFSAHRWADESTNCQIYWTISKNQDGTYSLNLINTNDSSKNFSDQVLSYTFFQNYQLDSGIIINNVMKMETKSLYIDLAYISGTEPAIRVYRLEDKENNLLVTQGRRIKDGALTAVRKKCS